MTENEQLIHGARSICDKFHVLTTRGNWTSEMMADQSVQQLRELLSSPSPVNPAAGDAGGVEQAWRIAMGSRPGSAMASFNSESYRMGYEDGYAAKHPPAAEQAERPATGFTGFNFDERTQEALDVLREQLGETSRAEVIRKALGFLDEVIAVDPRDPNPFLVVVGDEKGRWVCQNPECKASFPEYINGCPHCWNRDGTRSSVQFRPANLAAAPPASPPLPSGDVDWLRAWQEFIADRHDRGLLGINEAICFREGWNAPEKTIGNASEAKP